MFISLISKFIQAFKTLVNKIIKLVQIDCHKIILIFEGYLKNRIFSTVLKVKA